MDVQLAFGGDIMMVLDECLPYPSSHAATSQSVARTVRWAEQAFTHYRRQEQDNCALFPIVQGSMFADLRKVCAEELLRLDADGYAIGGLSVGEPRALSLEMVELTAPILPQDKPRYAMGVGMPEELPEYVARGIDMMDCVIPSRDARNGRLYTSSGKMSIKQVRYRNDSDPVDGNCACYTCTTFTRSYLRHLYQAGEILYSVLATLHNVTYYLDIMRKMREAILLGAFPKFLAAARGAGPVQNQGLKDD